MRIAALIALSMLAACGQPGPPAQKAAPPPPLTDEVAIRAALGAAPEVVRTYAVSDIKASGRGVVSQRSGGAWVTTDQRAGAFSAILDLGEEALGERQMAVRATVRVQTGVFQLVMTRKHWPTGYRPFARRVSAGEEVTVYLPIDKTGAPLLIVANGVAGGSEGVVTSVELVAAPAH